MSSFDIDTHLDALLDGKATVAPPATLERPIGRPSRPTPEPRKEARPRPSRHPRDGAMPAPSVNPPAALPPPVPTELRFNRETFYAEQLRLLNPRVVSGELTPDEARERAEFDTRIQVKLFGGENL